MDWKTWLATSLFEKRHRKNIYIKNSTKIKTNNTNKNYKIIHNYNNNNNSMSNTDNNNDKNKTENNNYDKQ